MLGSSRRLRIDAPSTNPSTDNTPEDGGCAPSLHAGRRVAKSQPTTSPFASPESKHSNPPTTAKETHCTSAPWPRSTIGSGGGLPIAAAPKGTERCEGLQCVPTLVVFVFVFATRGKMVLLSYRPSIFADQAFLRIVKNRIVRCSKGHPDGRHFAWQGRVICAVPCLR